MVNGTVITADGGIDLVRFRALTVIKTAPGDEVLDISEFEKGGGSLSCLSLLWRDD